MKNKYWVVWTKNVQKWQVKKSMGGASMKNFDVKKEAISYALELAKKNAPSQLTIRKKDGSIEEERQFSNDK